MRMWGRNHRKGAVDWQGVQGLSGPLLTMIGWFTAVGLREENSFRGRYGERGGLRVDVIWI
jgi:hypothetical protein